MREMWRGMSNRSADRGIGNSDLAAQGHIVWGGVERLSSASRSNMSSVCGGDVDFQAGTSSLNMQQVGPGPGFCPQGPSQGTGYYSPAQSQGSHGSEGDGSLPFCSMGSQNSNASMPNNQPHQVHAGYVAVPVMQGSPIANAAMVPGMENVPMMAAVPMVPMIDATGAMNMPNLCPAPPSPAGSHQGSTIVICTDQPIMVPGRGNRSRNPSPGVGPQQMQQAPPSPHRGAMPPPQGCMPQQPMQPMQLGPTQQGGMQPQFPPQPPQQQPSQQFQQMPQGLPLQAPPQFPGGSEGQNSFGRGPSVMPVNTSWAPCNDSWVVDDDDLPIVQPPTSPTKRIGPGFAASQALQAPAGASTPTRTTPRMMEPASPGAASHASGSEAPSSAKKGRSRPTKHKRDQSRIIAERLFKAEQGNDPQELETARRLFAEETGQDAFLESFAERVLQCLRQEAAERAANGEDASLTQAHIKGRSRASPQLGDS